MHIDQALIPAAGLGTRLRPLTYGVPKELLTVQGIPLIEYAVNECLSAGVAKILIVINEKKTGIKDYLSQRFGNDIHFIFLYQKEPTGVLDAVLLAENHLGGNPFFVVFPDIIYEGGQNPLQALSMTYEKLPEPSVALVRNFHRSDVESCKDCYGHVEFENISDEVKRITMLLDKGKINRQLYKSIGRVLWDSEVFNTLKSYRRSNNTEGLSEIPVIQHFIEQRNYYGVALSGKEFDCGTRDGLLYAEKNFSPNSHVKKENSVKNPDISVVIPVYNEEEALPELYAHLIPPIESISNHFEIILVDDGSHDDSYSIMESIANRDRRVKTVKLARNFGQHAAISAGLKRTKGDVVVTMDADLQNPPEEIPKLLEGIRDGYDLVWGKFEGRSHSTFRILGSSFAKYVLKKMMGEMTTNISTFRAIDRNLIERLNLLNENTRFLDGLLIWAGAKSKIVPVRHNPRQKGQTKYNVYKLVRLWFDMVTSFSDLPLKLSTIVGAGLGLIGTLGAVFFLLRKLIFDFDVPGFASLIVAIFLFSGIQLFCIGMLGEYVGRIFVQSKNRPPYIVEKEQGL